MARLRGPSQRGFTLIELLLVVSIIMVLIGLALPALTRTRYEARATRALLAAQQNTTLISQYAQDWRDVFPIAEQSAFRSMLFWYKPLVHTGLLATREDADRDGWRMTTGCTFTLSMCVMMDPAQMVRGATVPVEQAFSRAVRIEQVQYPSAKGILNQFLVWYSPHDPNLWAGGPAQRAPVQFADGSGEIGVWTQYTHERTHTGELLQENTIGTPVMSTWGGFSARDR